MKTTLTLLLAFLVLQSAAQQISGRTTDEKNNPLPSVIIQVLQGQVTLGACITDFDGQFSIEPIKPGYYDLVATGLGYDTAVVKQVLVELKQNTLVNFTMTPIKCALKEIIVRSYKKPLVASMSHSMSASEINAMPSTQIADALSVSPGVYQRRRGDEINTRGARMEEPPYIIDGVQVQGSSAFNNEQRAAAQFYDPSIETYTKNPENDFRNVKVSPLSTMSVDVDRASYSNVRRFLNEGRKPPVDAVRIEEMVNYFEYEYSQPKGQDPIAITTELTDCPWQYDHKLLHIGIQALKVNTDKLPPSNMVFLIDVSGSMESPERLPLLIACLKLLVDNLRPIDKVSIVAYAGNAGLVLPPTNGNNKRAILEALDRLRAGGSTAGGAGIELAYKIACENFIKGGNNRVLLATDGDFNVGVSNENDLEDLITKKRETGVFLTCLGFGTDNFKDSKMELLADKGNGNYDYIDNIQEAQKTLVTEFGGTLFTIAKDVKAQIEFNPEKVQGYRLIGYEDRILNTEDFKDDKKDAGDMGSGHTVTIMYEIIPAGTNSECMRDADDLKYQLPVTVKAGYNSELATIKFRYKKPDGDTSKEMTHIIADKTVKIKHASENSRFATSVAMFGMLLKDSKYKGSCSYKEVIDMAESSKNYDKDGYRSEFVRLVKTAKEYDVQGKRE